MMSFVGDNFTVELSGVEASHVFNVTVMFVNELCTSLSIETFTGKTMQVYYMCSYGACISLLWCACYEVCLDCLKCHCSSMQKHKAQLLA